ncbi:hypothetical protein KQX54_009425 [Cotesia glomerata]|uniref:Uncharacterized protein n=1 Tax=Cotesia glomerata TaxID=32391 RepID=A0AAV7J2T8_COTGL|nr:hypothetical protein KQX54_009425 [Cotesia glomerata]
MRSLLLCTLRTHFEVPGARNSDVTQVSQKYQVDPPAEIPEIPDDTVPERSLNTPKHSENCFPLLYGNDYSESGLVRHKPKGTFSSRWKLIARIAHLHAAEEKYHMSWKVQGKYVIKYVAGNGESRSPARDRSAKENAKFLLSCRGWTDAEQSWSSYGFPTQALLSDA